MNKNEIPVENPENEDQPTTQPETGTAENKVEVENDTTEEGIEEEVTEEKKTKKAGSEVEQLQKELSEMKDKYLRIFAEFDNYRKRTIKERQDIIKLAARDSINAFLPSIDDFERAIKAAENNSNEEKVPDGIVMIFNKLFKTLEQQGLKIMESTGATFDPELHEAVTKIPAPTEEMKGKVIDTVEKGYYLNDKIIRYAKVVVGE